VSSPRVSKNKEKPGWHRGGKGKILLGRGRGFGGKGGNLGGVGVYLNALQGIEQKIKYYYWGRRVGGVQLKEEVVIRVRFERTGLHNRK